MTKCWRCGGGKTISTTTTGTHALPCPTCAGSGESTAAQEEARNKVVTIHYGSLEAYDPTKSRAVDAARDPFTTGSKP